MNKSRILINSAVASVLAMGVAASGGVYAADAAMEKCAGIVKAGQNDCATSTTACHGTISVDSHQEAWIYVPKGTCEKVVGGHITHQKAPKEKS